MYRCIGVFVYVYARICEVWYAVLVSVPHKSGKLAALDIRSWIFEAEAFYSVFCISVLWQKDGIVSENYRARGFVAFLALL